MLEALWDGIKHRQGELRTTWEITLNVHLIVIVSQRTERGRTGDCR